MQPIENAYRMTIVYFNGVTMIVQRFLFGLSIMKKGEELSNEHRVFQFIRNPYAQIFFGIKSTPKIYLAT